MTVLNERPDFVVILRRNYEDKLLTLADLEIWHKDAILWQCVTLEPPWLENCPFISRIPEGWYPLRRGRYNKGGYDTWEIHTVPEREGIKFHAGNYHTDTDGCPLVGNEIAQGNRSIVNSRATHAELMKRMSAAQNPVLVVLDPPIK